MPGCLAKQACQPWVGCPRLALQRSGLSRRRLRLAAAGPGAQEAGRSKLLPAAGVLPRLLWAGATLGPALDGIHGTVHLLTYKAAPLDIGGLHSSLWVPPLLAAFYAVLGALHVLLDGLALADPGQLGSPLAPLQGLLATPGNAAATRAAAARASGPFVALNTGAVAALLWLSAVLYSSDWPFAGISAVLAPAALLGWWAFDGTRQGLALAALSAIAAPASELLLINGLDLWQYGRPDVLGPGGFPSWVPWCYFAYSSGVGNLTRLLQQRGSR